MAITTRKAFRTAVQKHVLESITEGQSVHSVAEAFKRQYGHQIKRVGERKAFGEWLQGLPSEVYYTYYTDEQLNTIKGFYGEDWDQTKFDKSKIDVTDYYNYLFTKEFFTLLNR